MMPGARAQFFILNFPVTDYFALLNEPRRPWLDPDSMKQTFLALAASIHPDRIHNADESEKAEANRRYAELNAAYNCLAEPKSRLRHLLELELGAKPKDVQQIPAALADLFAEVATICRDADTFLAEKGKATSPLLQVRLFERAQDWIENLNRLQKKLNELRETLASELKSLDEKWTAAGAASRGETLPKLEELYRLFGYFNRWSSQIQERVVRLTL
jgi:DnaJ-domain-containing protein 1